MQLEPDEMIRQELVKIKGIGHWTVDVYLMMALQRSDLFPVGDIALIKSIKEVKQLPAHTTKEEIINNLQKAGGQTGPLLLLFYGMPILAKEKATSDKNHLTDGLPLYKAFPALIPVCFPLSTVSLPFTKTNLKPVEY